MKPTVVAVRVNNKPEYRKTEQRWLESYLKFRSGVEHDLVIIDRNGDSEDDIAATHLRYDLGGWDCGAWQFAGRNIETDLLVCFNSSTYVTGPGWLERFVEAAETHGDGLYGPLASYEIIPHLRTPCLAFQPHVIRDYPREVMDRESTYRFEVFGWPDGTPNFTQWVRQRGLSVKLVTWDTICDQGFWREPDNIFRRGDQSNLLVRDRHADAYSVSDDAGKRMLEGLADTLRV